MSAATDRVTELRAELARAEEAERVERLEKRRAEQAARRVKLEADTEAYRNDEYSAYAGPHDSYVGISGFHGGIELNLCEFTSFKDSVTLTREEALSLAESIQKFLK
jgi:hypothetical protein